MSGSATLRSELMKALLSAHHNAKDDNDYLTKVSIAVKGFFELTEDLNHVEQDEAETEEKTNITLVSLPLLPLEKIVSYLDFESLVSQSCILGCKSSNVMKRLDCSCRSIWLLFLHTLPICSL